MHPKSPIPRFTLLTFNLLLVFLLTSCGNILVTRQLSRTGSVSAESNHSVGQTFVGRLDGLEEVRVWLAPRTSGSGKLVLHLRSDPQSSVDLASSEGMIADVEHTGFYRFSFSPQSHSYRQYVYILLEVQGEGSVEVSTGPGDSYIDGSLYQDNQPQEGQITFETGYAPLFAVLGLIKQSIIWLIYVLIWSFLFILPGWALGSSLLRQWRQLSIFLKAILAGGIGLALIPLFFLWASLVHLKLGVWFAWLFPVIALVFIIYRNQDMIRHPIDFRNHFQLKPSLSDVLFLFIIVLIFFTRFWAINSLDAPMWGDSYQHTMMAQLMAENGGLFTSWLPYTPYHTLSIQFGFPTWVVQWMWLTGIDSVKSILIIGQIINVFAVLVLYPLALRFTGGNHWAGLSAVIFGGLISAMPAFYINWGRYAQLAGQAILPVSAWLLWSTIDECPPFLHSRQLAWRIGGGVALASITLSGMLLTYYRMPFYYGTLALVFLLGTVLSNKNSWREWLPKIANIASVAIIAGILFLPWGIHMLGGKGAGGEGTNGGGSITQFVFQDYQQWKFLFTYVPPLLFAISLVAMAWSLIRKRWLVACLGLWVVLLASLVALNLIHFPGASLMQNFAVLISLYIPLSLLGGWLVSEVIQLLFEKGGRAGQLAAILLFGGATIWFALGQRNIAQPTKFAMVTRPDMRAMAWIRDHTPADARFLVEGFRAYNGTSAAGTDAGWWIPLLAGRENLMPPQYAILNEAPDEPGFSEKIVSLLTDLEENSPGSPQGIQILCNWRVSYIYIGQGQGRVSFENSQLFSPEELLQSPDLIPVYHLDHVYIFSLKPGLCSEIASR